MSGLSGEDRARLEGLLDYLQRTEDHPQAKADVDVFARALALIDQQEKALEWQGSVTKALLEAQARYVKTIDQQEKALEAADELAEFAEDDAVSRAIVATSARAYRSARATSTKEDG